MTEPRPRPKRWQRFLPKGLFARAFLILIAPVVILQIVVTLVFIQRHLDGVTRQMSETVAMELRSFAAIVESQPDIASIERTLVGLSDGIGYPLSFAEDDYIDPQIRRPFYRIAARALIETMQSSIEQPISVDTERVRKAIDVKIQLTNGVLTAQPPERRMMSANPHFLLVWMAAVSVFLLVIASLFLRNQVRPIKQLAAAAEAFGKGQPAPSFKPAGAEEVRRAASAFLTMRNRIERQIAQRTLMLSGVSHDLRTPLTRMRLALAMMDDDPDAALLRRDVDEMERMVDGFLAFARGQEAEEVTPTDLRAVLEDVIESERRLGHEIISALPDPAASRSEADETTLSLRRDAVHRCLRNLIENAAKYGGGKVWVTLDAEPRRVTITIEDDGPGVPEAQREDIVRPFFRGDAARNQDSGGGSGLGFSIAMDVMRAHGGDMVLSESAHGGLLVRVHFPR